MFMNDQQLITLLHAKGFKVTPQRLAICRIMLSNKEHPTAEQIYEQIKKQYPTISLATVYQTLHMLTKIGLVQEIGISNGVSIYDPNNLPHINIICVNCGKIYDYESNNVKELLSQINQELKNPIIKQNLQIYTFCNNCPPKQDA